MQSSKRTHGGQAKDNTRDWHPRKTPPPGDVVARRLKQRLPAYWTMAMLLFVMLRPDAAMAQTLDEALESAGAGSLLFRMQNGYRSAVLLDSSVHIEVSGMIARVRLEQAFTNESSEWLEGVYVFPLPDDAAVDSVRLTAGERVIEGEIREIEAAKTEYAEARDSGRKATIVEQRRENLFTTAVANVAPGEKVIVEIAYLEEVRYTAGEFALRFPMTLTPRYIPGAPLADRKGSGWSPDTDEVADASLITPPMVAASRGHRLSLTARIDAGVPLGSVVSRYHPVAVRESGQAYTVALAGDSVPMDHDFELVWRPVPSAAPRAAVFTEQVGGEPHYLFMVLPPDAGLPDAAAVPRELILVVDTSGSMHGVSIAQAKSAVLRALGRLDAGDRFNVIEFNSATRAVFGASVPASSRNIATAEHFVHGLGADGGTEMRPALELALAFPASETHLRQILFVTDGSVGNEAALYELIERRLGPARLFTVGIGSAPNSWFMRKAAELGRGTFTIISAQHEVEEKMEALLAKLEQPQVTDIRVDWPGGAVIESYPAIVPDLYSGEPVVVRARARDGFRPGRQVRIAGSAPSGAWSQTLSLDVTGRDPGVGALWARARIEALADEERRGAAAETVRAAIVETALAHHLVSRYTALVAVDRTPSRPAGEALATGQVPNLLPHGQSMKPIFGFPATATGAPLARVTGFALLAAALLLLFAMRALRPGFRVAGR